MAYKVSSGKSPSPTLLGVQEIREVQQNILNLLTAQLYVLLDV